LTNGSTQNKSNPNSQSISHSHSQIGLSQPTGSTSTSSYLPIIGAINSQNRFTTPDFSDQPKFNFFNNFSENSRGSGFSEPDVLENSFSSVGSNNFLVDESSRQSACSEGVFQVPEKRRKSSSGMQLNGVSSAIKSTSTSSQPSASTSTSTSRKRTRENSSPNSESNFKLKLINSTARRSLFPTPGYSSQQASQDFQKKAKNQLDQVAQQKSFVWRYNFKDDCPFGERPASSCSSSNTNNNRQGKSPNTVFLPLTGGSTPASSVRSGGSSSIRSSPVVNSESLAHNDPQVLGNWKLECNAPTFYRRTTRSQAKIREKYMQQPLSLPKNFQTSLQQGLEQAIGQAGRGGTPIAGNIGQSSFIENLNESLGLAQNDGPEKQQTIIPIKKTKIRNSPSKREDSPKKTRGPRPIINKDYKTPKKQQKITDFISPRKGMRSSNKSVSPSKSVRGTNGKDEKGLIRVKKKIKL